MTDRTQPDSASTTGSTHIIRYALELGLLWIDGSGRDKVREALDALDTLESQLEAIGAGGVSGPLMGIASLSANAGEPWTGGEEWEALAWHLCAEENGEDACGELLWEGGPIPEPWGDRWMKYESDAKRMIELVRKFVAAPPTAQAEGWRPIETAPRDGTEVLADTSGLGRVVVYWDDEESQWGTGLGYLDRGAPTHWMPLPPPPTSAEGVEHG